MELIFWKTILTKRKNLRDFSKRLCGIYWLYGILEDILLKAFLQLGFFIDDFNGFIT